MAKLNKKRCAVIAGAILIAAVLAAVLAADYAGVFGKVLGCGVASTGFSFKWLDKATGSRVAGVQLGCFFEGKQTRSASIRVGAEGSTNDGTIKGRLMYGYSRLETRFFILRDAAAETRRKSVKFVFSHPSYQKEARTYVVGDLGGYAVIELGPVEPGEMP